MSSPSSSSSGTAGRRRWIRPRRLRRRELVEWSAAAAVAAALYLTPAVALAAAFVRSPWPWVLLVACIGVLVAYTRHGMSPLVVLGILVLLGLLEFVANLALAVAGRCGDSDLAGGIEVAGTVVLLLLLGAWGIRRQRLYLLPAGLVAAAVWVSVVAQLVPGGSGACFD